MSRYTEETQVIKTQGDYIKFLERGIKYIYNPDAPNMYKHFSNEYWVEVNTKHMEFILNKYSSDFKGYDHSIIIQINEEVKYISSDYKSIINYFRETAQEYKNNIHKIVCIKYNFH
jgi:hypothetical protein